MKHDIVWTEETITKFWDNYSKKPGCQELYFSAQRGASMLRRVKKIIDIGNRVLDYGCGCGHLLSLLRNGERYLFGVDYSVNSLVTAGEKLPHAFFQLIHRGNIAAIRNMDTIFCLEVVEHMMPSDAVDALRTIHDMLAPGGHVVLTTPYKENYKAHVVCCPACGATYHESQHMYLYDPILIKAIMMDVGFETVDCSPRFFCPDPRIYLKSMKGRGGVATCPECGMMFIPKKSFLKKIQRLTLFNILYIGRKE